MHILLYAIIQIEKEFTKSSKYFCRYEMCFILEVANISKRNNQTDIGKQRLKYMYVYLFT